MALFLVYRNGSNLLNWLLVLYSWAFIVGITGRYFPKGVVERTHHDPSLVVTVVIVTLSWWSCGSRPRSRRGG